LSSSTGTRLTVRLVLLALSGSADAAHPSTDELQIVSDPLGASALVTPDGARCTTPCRVVLARLREHVVEISKPGYGTVSVRIEVGSDRFWSERYLTPNPVRVVLKRSDPSPAVADPSAAPPLPEPVASLENCIQPSVVDREACFGRLKLRMPRDLVETVLGPPDGTTRDGTTLRYGDRYLKFDADGRLAEISDKPQ
jgi:hypothetical protein